ncbi:putative B3 domain-containing protein At5g58280 isoform X2 [Cynara cardunculus var. scolymus]|uniref:putative B3 domain-containing protein At5g58280 isoform X2 n=1 Tax=Cynara cardunculus var. scolymus TaxID=59895 RepID=UPI000D623ADB|nr:putative B3 domain-containing protein At5g58280 isoform X2 [Cynara cardunculus var. scolymus]
MAEEITSNSYEEARKQQLLENKKRFEDLGILKISKSLSDLSKSEKQSKQREVKPKIRNALVIEPRRSTRARNPAPSYQDDLDIGLPSVRRRSNSNSSWASYLARPLEEVKTASYEERVQAIRSAEKVQSNLQSEYPSFVKSMGLPTSFCKKHLPKSTVSMVLENEDGNEYDAVFISERTGLSGGWRAFALEHKLDDGDALVFELVEPTRFKIYIVKAASDDNMSNVEKEAAETKETSSASKKRKKTLDSSAENGKKLKDVEEEAAETKETSTASKKRKKTLDSSAENGKEAAETKEISTAPKRRKATLESSTEKKGEKPKAGSHQTKKPKENVTATRRSTRKRNGQ